MKAITAVHDIGTWKKRILALSSSPGITGNSYHRSGWGTIGNARAVTMTPASQIPRTLFERSEFMMVRYDSTA